MNKIVYKKASAKDLKVLFDLSVEFESFNKTNSTRPHEHFSGDWKSYFADEIKDSLKNKNAYVFLAYLNNFPAGYVYARLCKECYCFLIEELFVKSDYNKAGIGTALLNLVIKEGKRLNYDIKVEVFDWNAKARDYYLKKGFELDSLVLKLSS